MKVSRKSNLKKLNYNNVEPNILPGQFFSSAHQNKEQIIKKLRPLNQQNTIMMNNKTQQRHQ